MKKIITVLITMLILFSCTLLPICADAWIPPDDTVNENLLTLSDSARKAVNIFLSNYIETGIISFDSSSGNDVVVSSMLKHFELNADAYKGSVNSGVSPYGKYMMIKGTQFENRTKVIFGRNISASSLEGYNNGWIYATAENYNTPVRCFASVKQIDYNENGEYVASFAIFASSSSIENLYGVSYYKLDKSGLTLLGEGYCHFIYLNSTATKFAASDFTLMSIDCDRYTVPHDTPCTPCDPDGSPLGVEPGVETAPVITETVPVESETVPETTTVAVTETTPETTPEVTPETTKPETSETTENARRPRPEPNDSADDSIWLPIIATGIIVLSVLAVAVIIVSIIKLKKK
ncbi:MAG: hypothetical protein IJA55_06970 [Clostridia bacterium]|nr:hypothetical protein [Clostridia bacterium]